MSLTLSSARSGRDASEDPAGLLRGGEASGCLEEEDACKEAQVACICISFVPQRVFKGLYKIFAECDCRSHVPSAPPSPNLLLGKVAVDLSGRDSFIFAKKGSQTIEGCLCVYDSFPAALAGSSCADSAGRDAVELMSDASSLSHPDDLRAAVH
ncbi:hypothetical protein QQF64_009338, partial [Cirrhinus molitorella]